MFEVDGVTVSWSTTGGGVVATILSSSMGGGVDGVETPSSNEEPDSRASVVVSAHRA